MTRSEAPASERTARRLRLRTAVERLDTLRELGVHSVEAVASGAVRPRAGALERDYESPTQVSTLMLTARISRQGFTTRWRCQCLHNAKIRRVAHECDGTIAHCKLSSGPAGWSAESVGGAIDS